MTAWQVDRLSTELPGKEVPATSWLTDSYVMDWIECESSGFNKTNKHGRWLKDGSQWGRSAPDIALKCVKCCLPRDSCAHGFAFTTAPLSNYHPLPLATSIRANYRQTTAQAIITWLTSGYWNLPTKCPLSHSNYHKDEWTYVGALLY